MPRAWKMLAAMSLVLAALAFALSAFLFTRLADTSRQTNKALCTFRGDLEQRIDNTKRFLTDHPHGIPGVPAGILRQSLEGQRRTVKALSGLDCPPRTF